jgi:glycosyltransferase involved in cell wall biosynthesis
MAAYYRCGNVFTLASQTEAFGTSYVEAMACNLPIVTTSDMSRAEIVSDAGILTDTKNIDGYSKDLLIASTSNYRNKPYNQALKYSWNKVAVKYSKLINELTD